jgi:hypothetical protein
MRNQEKAGHDPKPSLEDFRETKINLAQIPEVFADMSYLT